MFQQRALFIDLVQQLVHVSQRGGAAHRHFQFRQLTEQIVDAGQELVQRRIEQTNSHRQSGHLSKDADEVSALQRQQFFERFLARADALRQNHLAHCRQSFLAEEHVFGATQSNAFGAKSTRNLGIARSVGIRAHSQSPKFVGPVHQLVKIGTKVGSDGRHLMHLLPSSAALRAEKRQCLRNTS